MSRCLMSRRGNWNCTAANIQEQNFWCQSCLCLTERSQHRVMFDMEGTNSAYLIFLASLEAGISLGGPSERSLWLGTRGSGLSLDPLWSSRWSFLACLGLKKQCLPWRHDQGAQSKPRGISAFDPQTYWNSKWFFTITDACNFTCAS